MKVFLTGASGFIGSAVGKQLVAEGHEVLGLARSPEAVEKVARLGMIPYAGDLFQPESLVAGVQEADATINCGTAMSFEVDRGAVEREAVLTILNTLVNTGKKFLYTSDQLLYGATGDGIADEDTPLNPPPFLAWRAVLEQEILGFGARGVVPLVVRPVAVYGHGQDRMMPMLVQAAQQAGYGFYIGDGAARWSTVHVDDLARLYSLMLAKAPAGTLLAASAEPPVSMKTLAEVAATIAGFPGQIESLSVEQAQALLGPYAPVQMFTTSLRVSAARAQQLLGWVLLHPSLAEEAAQGVYNGLRQGNFVGA
jgi:nucleoside-diphosphate-sugar epimerase